jgi:hypothetical protein
VNLGDLSVKKPLNTKGTKVPIAIGSTKGTKEKALQTISAKFKDFYRYRENKNHCYRILKPECGKYSMVESNFLKNH